MTDTAVLRDIVAEMFQVPAPSVGPEFVLRHPRLQGSAARGLLAAAIRRRLGVYCPGAFRAKTYGELVVAVTGLPPDEETSRPARSSEMSEPDHAETMAGTSGAPPRIGLDVELVESMPDADDYWSSDFYRTHFSHAEIAYCARQEHPRIHFAARWCAKEALAKCDARYRSVDPATLQVALTGTGAPRFERIVDGRRELLPFAVSLTHTSLLAAAVVAGEGPSAHFPVL